MVVASRIERLLLPGLVAAAGWAALWVGGPLWLQALAAVALGVAVPGLLLTQLLLGSSESPPTPLERIIYPVALGFAVQTLLILSLSYLPGGLTPGMMQGAFALLSGVLAVAVLLQRAQPVAAHASLPDQTVSRLQMAWIAVALVAIGAIGAWVRLANIGYAEFHGDEARAVLRAAAIIQGYENTLFIHRKPPGEILTVAAIFGFAGHLNEAAARLPFALANLTALLGVFLIGWRVRSPVTGLAAALLLAVDGYLVAFSRFVQYQSVVLLMAVAATALFLRLYREPRALGRYLAAGALLLATALLFHWDGLLAFLPAAVLLLAMGIERRVSWSRLLRAASPALLLGAAALALYFLPYLLQPTVTSTAGYLVEDRLLGEAPGLRNNLATIVGRSAVYTSIWYLVALALLAWTALVAAVARGWGNSLGRGWGRTGALVAALLPVAAAALFFLAPEGGATTALMALALLLPLAAVWSAPRLPTPERMLWLWFGLPLLASLFLIATPRTHVHIFFVPWALVAGLGVAELLAWLEPRLGKRAARGLALAGAASIVLVVGGWLQLAFVNGDDELVARGAVDRPALYWLPRDAATVDAKYGFPINNGWKSLGLLYRDGTIAGDYGAVLWADFAPAWYLRGQNRCASSADWMLTPRALEPWAERPEDVFDRVESQGFALWADLQVGGRPAMRVFARTDGAPPTAPAAPLLDATAAASAFDAGADPYLPLSFPAVVTAPPHRLDATFGNIIQLEGFGLDVDEPLQPGDSLALTLYWHALATTGESYKVTNQLHDGEGTRIAQRDSMPLCDRSPTDRWRDGESIIGRHTLQIAPDAAAGAYMLDTALYNAETGERLPLLDAAGQPVDDKVTIATLEVVAP
jgi:4-amino-4-deoxy-L-arabinose transferase-like glycosyltransferase